MTNEDKKGWTMEGMMDDAEGAMTNMIGRHRQTMVEMRAAVLADPANIEVELDDEIERLTENTELFRESPDEIFGERMQRIVGRLLDLGLENDREHRPDMSNQEMWDSHLTTALVRDVIPYYLRMGMQSWKDDLKQAQGEDPPESSRARLAVECVGLVHMLHHMEIMGWAMSLSEAICYSVADKSEQLRLLRRVGTVMLGRLKEVVNLHQATSQALYEVATLQMRDKAVATVVEEVVDRVLMQQALASKEPN